MKIQQIGLLKGLFSAFETTHVLIQNVIEESLLSIRKPKYVGQGTYSIANFDSVHNQEDDQYLTVAQLSERYPAFTQGSIRWLIFNQDQNGFAKVVRKIGRKVVLNLKEWKRFLANAPTK